MPTVAGENQLNLTQAEAIFPRCDDAMILVTISLF